MTNTELEQRVDTLEAHIAEQDQTIEQLNTTITDQWRAIDRLKLDLARLVDEMQNMENTSGGGAGEKPPHY